MRPLLKEWECVEHRGTWLFLKLAHISYSAKKPPNLSNIFRNCHKLDDFLTSSQILSINNEKPGQQLWKLSRCAFPEKIDKNVVFAAFIYRNWKQYQRRLFRIECILWMRIIWEYFISPGYVWIIPSNWMDTCSFM